MTDSIGAQRLDDRRGWLVFESLPDDLARAEDATLGADHERMPRSDGGLAAFTRPATATERRLLDHLGYALPANLATQVRWLTNGLRLRRWPTLENGS